MDIMDNNKKELANPSKFGLASIAIALFMLGFAHCEVIPLNSVVLATILTTILAYIITTIAVLTSIVTFMFVLESLAQLRM